MSSGQFSQYYLVFQPIVRIFPNRTYQVEEFEVLLRSKTDHRFPAQDFFQQISSQEGNRSYLTWFQEELLPILQAYPDKRFSINFEPQQLSWESSREFFQALSQHAHHLMVEVTERGGEKDNLCAVLGQLRSLGYRIALDDFGRGQNTVGWLECYGNFLDRIKLSLVATSPDKAISDLQNIYHYLQDHTQAMDLVVEGVETLGMSQDLYQQGLILQQGYYFGKGQPI